jgi:hypothetical protein
VVASFGSQIKGPWFKSRQVLAADHDTVRPSCQNYPGSKTKGEQEEKEKLLDSRASPFGVRRAFSVCLVALLFLRIRTKPSRFSPAKRDDQCPDCATKTANG